MGCLSDYEKRLSETMKETYLPPIETNTITLDFHQYSHKRSQDLEEEEEGEKPSIEANTRNKVISREKLRGDSLIVSNITKTERVKNDMNRSLQTIPGILHLS